MNEKVKNILGITIAIAVLAVGFAAINYANSFGASIQPSSFRSFSVTGDGKATAIPDVAEFTFQVITEGGNDLGSLQTENTASVNKAIAFVQSEGVADKDIQTESYDIEPRYQTSSCNQPVIYSGAAGSDGVMIPTPAPTPCPPASIVGYTVTESVDVKIRDFTKIGDILGGVVTNGANQVGQLSFTMDDPTAAQEAARADAITKAKAEAVATAQAGGFTLGRLLGIQDGGNTYPAYPVPYAMNASVGSAGGATAAAAPSVQPGSQEVDAEVTLQYEIK